MEILWKSFTTAKLGNSSDENEDAFAPNESNIIYDLKPSFSCAIADGATEAAFSKLWANIIVRHVEKNTYKPSKGNLGKCLPEAQNEWIGDLKFRSLPWFAEEKIRKGSFTSLLWFNLIKPQKKENPKGTWKALAIGDSNLFQIRQDQIVRKFPIEKSKDFGNFPFLLPSISNQSSPIWDHVFEKKGEWNSEDDFFLMTDAIAAWFLRAYEMDQQPIHIIRNIIGNSQDFDSWVNERRINHEMKNDDTTLISIQIQKS